jgi:molecular chaperone GrpE
MLNKAMENEVDKANVTDNQIEGEANAPAALPTDAPEAQAKAALEALQKDLQTAQAKATEYLDGWQRARAELTNYKRRIEKEQAEIHQNAAGRIIARYLEVLDDFDRAMQERPAAENGDLVKWADGTALIYRKLRNVLEAEGVARIEAEGKEFDPNLHEAVTQEPCDTHPTGHVIAVVRQGYKLGDKVIRPALVRVEIGRAHV